MLIVSLKGQNFIFYYFIFFNFYFYFILLYNTTLVLPYIDMNQPRVYMSSQSWTPLPPPTSYLLSGSSPCTSPKHPVSCIKHTLVICFLHDSIHVSVPFSQIIPPSPSPIASKRLFYTSVSAFFTVQLSHPYMTTGKTIALTRWTFVGKVTPLLFNMLSRLVITFLPRSKWLLISWLQSPSAVILEPRKISHCFHYFPIYLPWSDGPDTMILIFWMLSFKPTFSLSSFIKRLFSSSLSAIRVVSSAYLRLLIFLLAILIPACASSSPVFLMMYSTNKLNNLGGSISRVAKPSPKAWPNQSRDHLFLICPWFEWQKRIMYPTLSQLRYQV